MAAIFTYLKSLNESLANVGVHVWIKYGIPLIYLAAFLVFASTPAAIVTSYVVPDVIRVSGTWFNNFAAIVMLCLMLSIIQTDLSKRN